MAVKWLEAEVSFANSQTSRDHFFLLLFMQYFLFFYFYFYFFFFSGESMNTVPHYHKLCSRVFHIWGNHKGQHIQSTMDKPRPGKTTFGIMVSPLPGTYFMQYFINLFIYLFYLCLRWVFVAVRGLSLVAVSRGYSCCGAQASHCGGFSCCGARALGAWAQ